MTRALARFTVAHGRIKLRVRLLATISAVDAEFHEGRRRQRGRTVFGYFSTADQGDGCVGTIVIPCDADLMELIPHEVTHAVLHRLGRVDRHDDEALASAVGVLTARIVRQLAKRGLGV